MTSSQAARATAPPRQNGSDRTARRRALRLAAAVVLARVLTPLVGPVLAAALVVVGAIALALLHRSQTLRLVESALEQRERERSRGVQVGQSARQHAALAPLHDAGLYDVAFDTTAATPQACAAEIHRRLSLGDFGRFSHITPQELP